MKKDTDSRVSDFDTLLDLELQQAKDQGYDLISYIDTLSKYHSREVSVYCCVDPSRLLTNSNPLCRLKQMSEHSYPSSSLQSFGFAIQWKATA